MNNIKLKTCPFCGGSAAILRSQGTWERAPKFFVACMKCGAETPRTSRCRSDAAHKWNTRAGKSDDCERCDYRNEFERLIALKNCNDCKYSEDNRCGCSPRPGETVRINCFLWDAKEEKP